MRKKYAMTAVALAAWMGVLTGCGAGSNDTTESTAAATTEEVTQAEETTAQTTAEVASSPLRWDRPSQTDRAARTKPEST